MANLKKSPLAPRIVPNILPVKGAKVAAVAAGLRYKGRYDLMLATFDEGTETVGVFTKSKTAAAPVEWCKQALSLDSDIKGLVVNAGNANAFTGKAGITACESIAGQASRLLACESNQILLASTGVIGEPLDPGPVCDALAQISSETSEANWGDAAEAIRTTDTFAKAASVTCEIDGKSTVITGIAKGSGMIEPDMATMLGFIITDAPLSQLCLSALLEEATDKSFNAITVDGDTSTNDCVLAFATGQAGGELIDKVDDPRLTSFKQQFEIVMTDLAHQIVRDGEGAQKFVEITISGAASDIAARTIGKVIANSPLVKTAIAGEDPNWGRIVMAVGKSGEAADRDALKIWIGDQLIAENGAVHENYSEDAAAAHMKEQEIKLQIDVGVADGKATVWTCDLTHQYIEINADYRS
jgi:glutamate N-acetyltransferase/amino-acid N-acetyltransferase